LVIQREALMFLAGFILGFALGSLCMLFAIGLFSGRTSVDDPMPGFSKRAPAEEPESFGGSV
jgi:hypothetical protein